MSVAGIGLSSGALDYWELLRDSEAKRNASVTAAAITTGEEDIAAEQTVTQTTSNTSATASERQNLYAQQLASTIRQEEKAETTSGTEAGGTTAPVAAGAIGGGSSSGDSSNRITVKSITEDGTRYLVGVRTDENGEEVEVFRIAQDSRVSKTTGDEPDKPLGADPPTSSEDKSVRSALSAEMTRQARLAYGMTQSGANVYSVAA